MPYCIKCGKPMADGAQYCYYCGQKSPFAADRNTAGAPVRNPGGRHAGAQQRAEGAASFSIPYTAAAECPPAGAETARRQNPPRGSESPGRAQENPFDPYEKERRAGPEKSDRGKTGLIVFAVVLCLLIAAEVWLAYSWFLA